MEKNKQLSLVKVCMSYKLVLFCLCILGVLWNFSFGSIPLENV